MPGLVPRFSLRVRNPGLGVCIDVPAADRVNGVGLQIPAETISTEPRRESGMAPGKRIEGVSQLRASSKLPRTRAIVVKFTVDIRSRARVMRSTPPSSRNSMKRS